MTRFPGKIARLRPMMTIPAYGSRMSISAPGVPGTAPVISCEKNERGDLGEFHFQTLYLYSDIPCSMFDNPLCIFISRITELFNKLNCCWFINLEIIGQIVCN